MTGLNVHRILSAVEEDKKKKRLSREDFHWEVVKCNDQNHMVLEITFCLSPLNYAQTVTGKGYFA